MVAGIARVTRILNKLGVESRTAASLSVRHGVI